MQQTAGRTLHHGRYQITSKLGQGGMGAVYLATDLNLVDRLVAIKENSLNAQHFRNQFLREAQLLSRLNHPHLPRVTDYFIEPDGTQYLVMDYVEGSDLEQLLRAHRGPLNEVEVLGWMEGVLDALEYMHTWTDTTTGQPHPIIHRDIKPSNIKRAPNGEIFLVDFGLAKRANSGATLTGARGITPGYSPIEQYEGGTDARSDIYSLGATLYVLLTGRKPPSATEIAAGTPLPAPRLLNKNLSRTTERAILRALQTQPTERFQHIRDMRAALSSRSFWPTTLEQAAEETSANLRSVLPKSSALRLQWVTPLLLLVLLLVGFLFYQPIARQLGISAPLSDVGLQNVVLAPTAPSTPTQTATVAQATAPEEPTALPTPTQEPTEPPPPTLQPTATQPVNVLAGAATAIVPKNTSVQPVATVAPTPTRRATVTPLPTAPPTATPTATPMVTATSQATRAPQPTAAQASTMSYLRLVSPQHNESIRTGQQLLFQWESDVKLAPGQTMEVVVWRPQAGATAMNDGRGLVDIRNVPVTQNGTTWRLAVQAGAPLTGGDYMWSVLLVEAEPYKRLEQLVQTERSFRIESSGGRSGDCIGAGCGEPEPEPPSVPEYPAP